MSYFYTYASQAGNKILYRYVKDGKRYSVRSEFNPTLFMPSKTESKFKTIDGRNVEPIYPGNMSECRKFVDQYKDVDGFEIFGNTDYRAQFIASEFCSGEILYEASLIRGFNIDIETPSLDEDGNSMGFPDPIEARFPITAVTVYDTDTDAFYTFGLKPYHHNKSDPDVGHLDVKYIHCPDEATLLTRMITWWTQNCPDYLTGWNIESFDIPYIVNRINKVLGDDMAKLLSPFKSIYERQFKDTYGNDTTTYELLGIATLDYIDLYKKHTYVNRESYKLDYIAHVELGDSKLDYSEAGSLNKLYLVDHDKFIRYNIKDVDIVKRLDDKLKLTEITFTLAYYARINYKDTLSPVKFWDNLIYHYLNERDTVVPFKKKNIKPAQFAGAYVMPPIVGKHKWVVSFDLNSLYPHLIQQYNIGPETLVPANALDSACSAIALSGKVTVDNLLKKEVDTSPISGKQLCLAANGQFFKTDKMSFLSQMMRDLYARRKADKKLMLKYEQELANLKNTIADHESAQFKMEEGRLKNLIAQYNNRQMAAKIALNSAYGATGNIGFRYYDLRIAEAITLGGQLSIRWIGKKLDEYFNNLLGTKGERYVIYTDTDSTYIRLDSLVNRAFKDQSDEIAIVNFLDTVCEKKIQPYINDCYQELADYMGAYEQRMFMGREVISSDAIWTSKKRYCMSVWDSEGVRYPEPKMKIMGLEAVKSSTPEHCRGALKACYQIALRGDNKELISFVEKFRKQFNNMELEDIAFPRSCNNLDKYADSVTIFKKGTPKHVKGSLLYNHLLKKSGLEGTLESIKDGDKIKFVELDPKNPTRINTISFPGYLPKELKMHRYVDRELMFQKSFLDPLSPVTDSLGWTTEDVISLDDFFA